MDQDESLADPQAIALAYLREYESLPDKSAKKVWPLRKRFARSLREVEPAFVLEVARELFERSANPGHANCLLMLHNGAFALLGEDEIVAFGQGIDSWGKVDSFARWLSGPAWLRGQISDELIRSWAASEDLWWRRAALVSTVALNVRSHAGYGDTERTLDICHRLVNDREDMVVKALSWALRELVVHDPAAVENFLEEYADVLAARVKREVKNKLSTGLKNPKRKVVRD